MTSKNYTTPCPHCGSTDPNIHSTDCPGGMPVAYAFFRDCTVITLWEKQELLGIRPCEIVFPRGIPRDWLHSLIPIESCGNARIYTGATLHKPGASYFKTSSSDTSEPSDDPLQKLKRNMLNELKRLENDLKARYQIECNKRGITSPEIERIRRQIETLRLIGHLTP